MPKQPNSVVCVERCQVNAVILVLVLRRISTANVRNNSKRNKVKFVAFNNRLRLFNFNFITNSMTWKISAENYECNRLRQKTQHLKYDCAPANVVSLNFAWVRQATLRIQSWRNAKLLNLNCATHHYCCVILSLWNYKISSFPDYECHQARSL